MVSIPDELLGRLDEHARQQGTSRSGLLQEADAERLADLRPTIYDLYSELTSANRAFPPLRAPLACLKPQASKARTARRALTSSSSSSHADASSCAHDAPPSGTR